MTTTRSSRHRRPVGSRHSLRSRVGALAVVLACAVSLSGCGAVQVRGAGFEGVATSGAAISAGKLVPRQGAYLGIFYGSGSPRSTDRRIGVTPKVHLTYFGWSDDWVNSASTNADLATGRIPLVNWEPFDTDFNDIVGGRYDDMLRQRAQHAAGLPRQIFVDFAAEMNEEEGWGGHDPALYKAAWRHVHDVFTSAGAHNVVWVWAPNNTDSAGAPPALDYYPGENYVDWTGMDGYNWGTSRPGFTWQTLTQVFAPLYRELAHLGKPIMIGETASDETGGNKAAWIADVIPTLRSTFPEIRAVVWFDIRKERRWQVNSSRASAQAFSTMARSEYWQR